MLFTTARSDHNQARKPNSSSTSTCAISLVSTTTKLNNIIIDCDWLKIFPLNHVGLWMTPSAVWKTVKLLSRCAVFLDPYWKQCCIKRGKGLLLFSSKNISYNKIISMSISEICWWPILPLILLYSSSSLNGIWEQEPLSKSHFPEVTLAWLR